MKRQAYKVSTVHTDRTISPAIAVQRIVSMAIPDEAVTFRTQEALAAHVRGLTRIEHRVIGQSRTGQDLFGVEFGEGDRLVSVIAGCHSDEPVGPMTAQALPGLLRETFPELLNFFRIRLIPQMNPDGAARNRDWFANPPDFATYVNNTVRELPGDDIEFGFGKAEWTRPECEAAMTFLKATGPYAAHFSLHGMAFAEGAWFLFCKEWRGKLGGIMERLTGLCSRLGMPLHDIDRKGEKGFHRIDEGFCTTPRSVAMKQFFLDRGDPETAEKFLPSSMEFVQSLGGNPLCSVSEIPLFLLGKRSPSLQESMHNRFRDELQAIRPRNNDSAAIEELADKYRLSPVPLELQIRLQAGLIAVTLAALA